MSFNERKRNREKNREDRESKLREERDIKIEGEDNCYFHDGVIQRISSNI